MSGEPGGKMIWVAAIALVAVLVTAGVLVFDRDDQDTPTTTVPEATGTTAAQEATAPTSTAPSTSSSLAPAEATEATVTVPPTAPPTTPPPLDDPTLGTEASRAVPLGEEIDVGVWRIGVSNAELDATETVLSYVDFNDPPADGTQYVLIELSGTQTGTSVAQPVFDWQLVHGEERFRPGERECGVFPNSIIDVAALSAGEDFSANVCFEMPTDMVDDELLLTLGLFAGDGTEWFFDLGPDA